MSGRPGSSRPHPDGQHLSPPLLHLAPQPGEATRHSPPGTTTLEELAAIIRAALDLGAAGYLFHNATTTELLAAVRTVANMAQPHSPDLGADPSTTAQLTDRDQTALRLWAHGYTNPQVAQALRVSLRTVTTIRASLRTRLGLADRTQIIAYVRAHLP